MLSDVGADYDYLIVDTQALAAPGSSGLDGALVAEQLDCCLVLLSERSATAEGVRTLGGILESIGRPCIGCVSRS